MNNNTITIVVWLTQLYCTAGVSLSVTDYAETYKVNGPTESCEEPDLKPDLSCGDKVTLYHSQSKHIYIKPLMKSPV